MHLDGKVGNFNIDVSQALQNEAVPVHHSEAEENQESEEEEDDDEEWDPEFGGNYESENEDEKDSGEIPATDLIDIIPTPWKHIKNCKKNLDSFDAKSKSTRYLVVEKFQNVSVVFNDNAKTFGIVYRKENQ